MRYAAVLAGGSGTRLWPMSRSGLPKQLIPLMDGKSLLQIAVERLQGLVDPQRQFICTGEKYRGVITQAMPEFDDMRIIGEPTGRDTLAAVGLTAAVAAASDPEAAIAIFTADHLIQPVDAFQQKVDLGYRIAENVPNSLVTFGIEPSGPATGYGYVELGESLDGYEDARQTVRFVEKPDAETAQRYFDSGRYAWNSGMFVWRAATLLECIRRYKPVVHEGLMRISASWGTDDQQIVLNEVFPTLQKISIDFAVMEPASTDPEVNVATVPMPVDWLDVGGWPAYGQTLPADPQGNRVSSKQAILLNSRNVLAVSDDPQHLIATVGIEDLVIVHTADATLICHQAQTESIKALHQQINEQFGGDYV